jgi:NADH-quinone oxidoreductase subunit D
LRIVEQALDKLPMGPVSSSNHKFVPPPRSEIGTSMEALIHHFKLWTEGFDAPQESVYVAVESPRGELAATVGDGGPNYRVHFRTPSLAHLQNCPCSAKGALH